MNVVQVYLRLYAACAMGAFRAIGTNPWTVTLPILALGAYIVGAGLAMRLGPGAGIALSFLQAALLSAYFYFVREGVAGSKVGLGELGKSLGAYLWGFVGVAFVLWIVGLVVSRFLPASAAGPALLFLSLAEFVLLNAAPEIITQRGTTGGLATIQGSIEFVQANWLEWLLPNVVIGAVLWFGVPLALGGVSALIGGRVLFSWLVLALGLSAVVHFAALFRGFLFRELDASGHRQRMFKYQAK